MGALTDPQTSGLLGAARAPEWSGGAGGVREAG
jgi:hypothetical protein